MDGQFSQDPSLVRDFVVESEELLQSMDRDMVALESAPGDEELLNRVFRALHTIKGTAGFLGFDLVVRLSHGAEDVLKAVRSGEVGMDRRVMDPLLAARDQLGIMLKDIGNGVLPEYEIDPLLADLHDCLKPQKVPTLGELLVKDAVITEDDLKNLLTEQAASREPRKLGQLIVEKGLSSAVQVGDALARQKKIADSSPSFQTMRIEARKLDELINLIGELVLERNRLVQLSRDSTCGTLSQESLDAFLSQSTARLSFITEELQSAGLKTRMVPIETVFHRFPRMVRDIARNLQKDVQLVVSGENTELDKTMIELTADPLVHLVRNSLDHGIETPEVRERAGKPRQGTIRLEALQEGDHVVISVRDDGAGIDAERVGKKAVEQGLITPERLRLLNPRETLELVFLPGLSTAEKASDLSGRGVGLDVVRSNLRKLNGSVEIQSQPGKGTTISLRLPLTLAILPVLLVGVGEEVYALPLRCVVETAQVNLQRIHVVEGCEILCLRDETLPLLRLDKIFKSEGNGEADGDSSRTEPGRKVVILAVAEKRVALLADRLLGQESTIVKSLGTCLHHCACIVGASISGEGRVRLVLDPAGLIAASESALLATGRALA